MLKRVYPTEPRFRKEGEERGRSEGEGGSRRDGVSNGPTAAETPLRRRAAFFLFVATFSGESGSGARGKKVTSGVFAPIPRKGASPLRRRSTSIGNSLCRSIKSAAAVGATELLLPKPKQKSKPEPKPKSLNHLCLPFLSSHDLTRTHSLTHSTWRCFEWMGKLCFSASWESKFESVKGCMNHCTCVRRDKSAPTVFISVRVR